MNFELLKQRVLANDFELTQHAHEERQAETIEVAEIREAILTGEVLEHHGRNKQPVAVAHVSQLVSRRWASQETCATG